MLNIGSGYGLLLGRHQAITWNNVKLSSNGVVAPDKNLTRNTRDIGW